MVRVRQWLLLKDEARAAGKDEVRPAGKAEAWAAVAG